MASIADILGPAAKEPVEGAKEMGDPAEAGGEGSSEEMARYAWEFKQAKDPVAASDALEAFVRLVMGA